MLNICAFNISKYRKSTVKYSNVIMKLPWYMQSVTDQKVVMRHMTISAHEYFMNHDFLYTGLCVCVYICIKTYFLVLFVERTKKQRHSNSNEQT